MPARLPSRRSGWWWLLVPAALVLWTTASGSGRTLRRRFFAALRIARPGTVAVNIPAFSGPAGSRRLQDAVASMLADQVQVTREPADTAVADSAAAARLAGFAPRLIAARNDRPSFSVQTARAISMTVDSQKLELTMREAAQSGASVPASVNGDTLAIETPPAVIARYGHCPALEGQTLTNQIAQRPPPAADQADCVILEQRPVIAARAPAQLDLTQLTGMALEIAGMSPAQAAAFQHAFPYTAALALAMPRFIRSYDTVSVHGAPGMLLNTAGRRGPTYELLWVAGDRVYVLSGYGNSTDAVGLANSIPTPKAQP